MDKEKIGPALGKLPSGVYIATSILDGEEIGMLASFVEQAGFEPPMITVALSSGRRLVTAIEQSGLIGINVLGDEDARLMKPFTQPDHTIYAAEVIDGILNDPSREPMVRIRKNGFQY